MTTHKSERWIWLLAVVTTIASVAPLSAGRYLPFADIAGHAHQVALWAAYSNDPVVHAHYDVHLASPYVVFYVLWRAMLALGFSLADGARLATGVSILAVPASLLLLLRVRQRPLHLAFLFFPFVYTEALAWGFLPFYLSVPITFASLALFTRWLRTPSVALGVLVTLSGLVVMWGHALAVVCWGMACGCFALFEPVSWRRRALAVAPLVPVGALLVVWTLSNVGVSGVEWRAGPLLRLSQLGPNLCAPFTPAAAHFARAGVVLMLVTLVAGIISRWRGRQVPVMALPGFDLPVLFAGIGALLMFFTVPFGGSWTANLNGRFAAIAYFLVAASLPPLPRASWRLALVTALTLVTAGQSAAIWKGFHDFNGVLGASDRLFQALPKYADVVRPQETPTKLAPFRKPVLEHVPQWASASALGPAAFIAVGNPQALMRESSTNPWPRRDAMLDRGDPAHWVVRPVEHTALPDYLMFFSDVPAPDAIPVGTGTGARYLMKLRSGAMNLFALQP